MERIPKALPLLALGAPTLGPQRNLCTKFSDTCLTTVGDDLSLTEANFEAYDQNMTKRIFIHYRDVMSLYIHIQISLSS